jgi:histidinol-phosphate phosphatase family protein
MGRKDTNGAVPRIEASAGGSIAMSFSQPRERQSGLAVFLDRDGGINEKINGGYVTSLDSFRFVPGILGALSELSAAPYPIIVVSNQAAVAKGFIARAVLAELTRRFVAQLQQSGARIDAVYYCPHTPEMNCHCRKPKAGLIERAAAEWGLDLKRSVLVGDSQSDLEAAAAAGSRAVLFAPGLEAGEHPPSPPGLVTDPAQLAPVVLGLLQAAAR